MLSRFVKSTWARKRNAFYRHLSSKDSKSITSVTISRKMDLRQFLETNKANYLEDVSSGKGRDWTVVMGNEAGDLDSIASSIAYSWCASTVQNTPTIALVQIPRADLKLRAENLYAFELAKLDPEHKCILCIDDIPTSSLKPFPSNKFALVDHNRLISRFYEENDGVRVVAVVDHHEDEGLYTDTADPRIVQVPTGSCTSLVTRLLRHDVPGGRIPEGVATLLLCGILIDTGGLKVGGKAEAVDRESALFLAPQVNLPSLSALSHHDLKTPSLEDAKAIQDLTQQLFDKKAAVSHLSTVDLLKRDYKEYTFQCSWIPSKTTITVGLSTVPLSLKIWIPKEGHNFWSSTENYMIDRHLTVLGILTSFQSKKAKHKRQVLFIIRPESAGGDVSGLEKRLWDGLEGSKELDLKERSIAKFSGMETNAKFDSTHVRAYKQRNSKLTRKFIAPLVKGIFEGKGADST